MIVAKFFRVTILLLCLVLFLSVSDVFASRAYYVDCSAESNGDGSYSKPWNNIASVNGHSFSNGDDVYFKHGITCNEGSLNIDWDGVSSSNRTVIGCYDGDNDFDCTGKTKPIIDGRHTYPTSETGLVRYDRNGAATSGWVTIQDLHIYRSRKYSLLMKRADGACSANGMPSDDTTPCNIIQRVTTDRSGYDNPGAQNDGAGIGIILSSQKWTIVQDCTTQYAGLDELGHWHKRSTNLVLTHSDGNLIRRNTVRWSGAEGLGVWHNSNGNIIEQNVVYDNWSYNLYPGNTGSSGGNTIRYNMVYCTETAPTTGKLPHPAYGAWRQSAGIIYDNEPYFLNCGKDLEIYGNLVAGCAAGISINQNHPECVQGGSGIPLTGIKIYNNTLVDNDDNFYIHTDYSTTSWDMLIRNNISLSIHANSDNIASGDCSHSGVAEWDNNLWSENLTGNCVADSPPNTGNIENGNVALVKTTGWRTMIPAKVDGSEFTPTFSSEAIKTGMYIVGYNDRIAYCDFSAYPINVIIRTYSTTNIGAMVQRDTSQFSIPPPTSLNIVRAE